MQLDAEIARIHGKVISPNGPLWEWWVIDGLDAVEGLKSGCFAVLFKLHHAAFDGVAAWEVINAAHDLEPGKSYHAIADADLPPTRLPKHQTRRLWREAH